MRVGVAVRSRALCSATGHNGFKVVTVPEGGTGRAPSETRVTPLSASLVYVRNARRPGSPPSFGASASSCTCQTGCASAPGVGRTASLQKATGCQPAPAAAVTWATARWAASVSCFEAVGQRTGAFGATVGGSVASVPLGRDTVGVRLSCPTSTRNPMKSATATTAAPACADVGLGLEGARRYVKGFEVESGHLGRDHDGGEPNPPCTGGLAPSGVPRPAAEPAGRCDRARGWAATGAATRRLARAFSRFGGAAGFAAAPVRRCTPPAPAMRASRYSTHCLPDGRAAGSSPSARRSRPIPSASRTALAFSGSRFCALTPGVRHRRTKSPSL